jgi:hypothetical protein
VVDFKKLGRVLAPLIVVIVDPRWGALYVAVLALMWVSKRQ